MASDGVAGRLVRNIWPLLLVLALFACPASAEKATFQTYNGDQGLSSLGGFCITQDHAGYLLVCTEHGVFTFDGRRFSNLGPDQGLRQGGSVVGLAVTQSGRIAVEFGAEVLVSDRASDATHPPSSLNFTAVLHPGVTFFGQKPNRMTSWQDGIVFLAGDATERIALPDAGPPRLETIRYDAAERALLTGAVAVFSVRGRLWETFEDNRICAAEPGAVKCYAAAEGLDRGPWLDITEGPGGRVLARSASSVGSFDPMVGVWAITELPDQGDRYTNYRGQLGLFTTPDGELVTQADHGLAILRPQGWRLLTVEDGAPSGTVVGAMTDAAGQFWFQVLGRGLVRWIGYGRWEALQKVDGLSEGIPWQTARSPVGGLWVATDMAVNEIVRRKSALQVARVFHGASFTIAFGPDSKLWRGSGEGVSIIETTSGAVTKLGGPAVDVIFPDAGKQVWIGTEAGLYEVEDRPRPPFRLDLVAAAQTQVPDLKPDGAGGVFYLSNGRLRHHRSDGIDIPVAGEWPANGFEPVALSIGAHGEFWVGGPGGLYRLVVSGDRVISSTAVSPADTRTNSIVAVMVDHRGWVWAGTALGASVFNGRRWVSVDADVGLVSNDVDQGGLREDPDGSVWIVTTQGVSHLLDTNWLFVDRPIRVVVSGAQLGGRQVTGAPMPYTKEGLTLTFGAPGYGAEQSFVFRYQLSGVDAERTDSPSGVVHYAFIPPGRHELTVTGYDALTHRSSPPATLVVDIGYPWWQRWWARSLLMLSGGGVISGAVRLQFRAMLARQAELERRVAEATEDLRYQAAHDSLTGLLNRREIERRLAARLSDGRSQGEIVVALVDIDHFKRVNDTHGHLGGDDVLRAMGRLVSKAVRDTEFAGRYGGEEILLALDDSDGSGAERVIDLHRSIRGGPFNAAGHAIRVTCSIGLAWAVSGDDWESLIGRADDALYQAKACGRDQVVENGQVHTRLRRGTA